MLSRGFSGASHPPSARSAGRGGGAGSAAAGGPWLAWLPPSGCSTRARGRRGPGNVPVCPPAPGVRSGRSPCVLGSARRAPSGQGQAGPELLGLALSERCPESSQCGVQRLCYGAGLPSWAWVGEERRENRQEPINAYK